MEGVDSVACRFCPPRLLGQRPEYHMETFGGDLSVRTSKLPKQSIKDLCTAEVLAPMAERGVDPPQARVCVGPG